MWVGNQNFNFFILRKEENECITISKPWDSIIFAQAIRGSMIKIQLILGKYIVLMAVIIAKNVSCILLFRFLELLRISKIGIVKYMLNALIMVFNYPKQILKD